MMASKKPIVFIIQNIFPSYRVPLISGLMEDNNFELYFLYTPMSLSDKQKGFGSVNVSGDRYILLSQNAFLNFLTILFFTIKKRPRLIITGKTDNWSFITLIINRLFNIKTVKWWGGDVKNKDNKINFVQFNKNKGIVRRLKLFFLNFYIAHFVYSNQAKVFLTEYNIVYSQIFVIPNSPDTISLSDEKRKIISDVKTQNQLIDQFKPNNEKIILLVGRLTTERRISDLFEAIHQLDKSNIKILIVGSGYLLDELEAEAIKLKINVSFLGPIFSPHELSKLYWISDLYITPGIASLSLKEAMVFAKPIITVNNGLEIHSVEDGINGFIFEKGDVKMLSLKIGQIFNDKQLQISMSNNSLKKIDIYNMPNMIKSYKNAIKAIL